jgi:hypothetical protein
MTVKCIPPYLKNSLLLDFVCGLKTINDMAKEANVSRRTIIRMLEEHDVDPGIRRRRPKPVAPTVAAKTEQFLQELQDISDSLADESTPAAPTAPKSTSTWLDRFRQRTKELFSKIYA